MHPLDETGAFVIMNGLSGGGGGNPFNSPYQIVVQGAGRSLDFGGIGQAVVLPHETTCNAASQIEGREYGEENSPKERPAPFSKVGLERTDLSDQANNRSRFRVSCLNGIRQDWLGVFQRLRYQVAGQPAARLGKSQ
jgi:hypothetical protein